jgi:hypothetical protein
MLYGMKHESLSARVDGLQKEEEFKINFIMLNGLIHDNLILSYFHQFILYLLPFTENKIKY